MANKIILKNRNSTSSPAPSTSDLDSGEIAINYHADVAKIYFKDSNNAIRTVNDSTQSATTADATALAIALG